MLRTPAINGEIEQLLTLADKEAMIHVALAGGDVKLLLFLTP